MFAEYLLCEKHFDMQAVQYKGEYDSTSLSKAI